MVENENDDPTATPVPAQTGVVSEDERSGRVAGDPPVTDVQAYIGRQLRAVYDDIAKQPIPDRFLDLMRQLETKGTG